MKKGTPKVRNQFVLWILSKGIKRLQSKTELLPVKKKKV